MRLRTKSDANRDVRCRVMTKNDIFNMASIRHLGFENLTFCKSFLIAVIYSDSASKILSKPEAPIFNWDIGITILISTAPTAMLDLWLRHNTVSGNRLKLSRHWVISSSWLGFVVSEILEIVFQRFGLILPDHAHIWFTHALWRNGWHDLNTTSKQRSRSFILVPIDFSYTTS